MLISLHVKNLALIEETEVNFKEGLNILSGETGAGKSIIIGSVNLALGARADKDMIRTGAEYALVELIFQVQDSGILAAVRALDIPVEEDGIIIIQRRILPGRSLCKICGETATAKQMKALAELLIDIHGQHEHQSLLYKKNHLEILDAFAGEELAQIKDKIKEDYHIYTGLTRELEALAGDEGTKAKELSLAEFEYNEIEEARPSAEEDEAVEQQYKRMANGRQLAEAAARAHRYTASDAEHSAGDAVGWAVRELRGVEEYDARVRELADELENIDALLGDFNRELSEYMADMEFDAETFAQTQERYNQLNHLKLKYGGTIERVLAYQQELAEKIDRLQNADAYKAQLEERIAALYARLRKECAQASRVRRAEAEKLSADMAAALADLNFLAVRFEIQVREKEEMTAGGFDEVEFMISTNPGEPVKSLGNVASGGELSRIMLAIKTVLAVRDRIPTLIFDEIDAGISGKTAWKVSEKLGALAGSHQIICITHLPQIAAMADSNFRIAKQVVDNKTITDITCLEADGVVDELARMLGGEDITDAVRENARELIRTAQEKKRA